MTTPTRLGFDPIERAGEHWAEHFGEPLAMKTVTSIMRVQQMLIGQIDATLRPFGITFARYEVLVLLRFSRQGFLPLSKVGERLMVHPTSVTNAIDRLEAQGFVRRVADETDRRRTFAQLTDEGRAIVDKATDALTNADFAIGGLEDSKQEKLYSILRDFRRGAGDFPAAVDPSVSDG